MSESASSNRAERLELVLAAYLRRVEAGERVDRDALLAEHPDLAKDLRSFLRHQDETEGLAEPLRSVAGSAGSTLPLAEADAVAVGRGPDEAASNAHPKVRYFGDYELIEEIARGGMGVVYRARQMSLNRPVAVKMILSGQMAGTDDIQRFRQEAEAAANLDHPHVVPIYEIGEHAGQHYFSMKLIEGGNLRSELPRLRQDQRAGVQLLATVVRAVHHAHQRGVLHRDLKPGNVLLDNDGQPHVTDFGLAKQVERDSDLTATGAILGTPAYMSPEQARGEKTLTTAVDIYSLGAMLYELLTGRTPFQGATPAETLLAVMSRDPERPSSIRPAVDPDLETIALKCLEKEPERRYDSAAALADDLERWLRSQPILARPASTWETLRKWTRRKPAQAALVAVAALACVVVAAVFGWSYYHISQAQAETLAALSDKSKALEGESAARRDVTLQRDRAVAARITGQAALARSLLSRAALERQANRVGARRAVLQLITQADKLRQESMQQAVAAPTADLAQLPARHELRSEAIEGLALPDVELSHSSYSTYGNGIQILPGGKQVILVNTDRKMLIDVSRQQEVTRWWTLGRAIAVHPSGKLVVTGRDGGGVDIGELPSAKTLRSAKLPLFKPLDLRFTRDGATLFALGFVGGKDGPDVPKRIYAIDPASGQAELLVEKKEIVASPQRSLVATAAGTYLAWIEIRDERHQVVLFDVAAKRELRSILPPVSGPIQDLGFDAITDHLLVLVADGRGVASPDSAVSHNTLLLSYEPEQEVPPREMSLPIANAVRLWCNPHTRQIAVGSEKGLVLLESPTKSRTLLLREPTSGWTLSVELVGWSPDGEHLVHGDPAVGVNMFIWRVRPNPVVVASNPRHVLRGAPPLQASIDGRWAVGKSEAELALVDRRRERVVQRFPLADVLFSPDGEKLAGWKAGVPGAPGWVAVWEIPSGREIARVEAPEGVPAALRRMDMRATFNRRGELIVLRSVPEREIWNVNRRELVWKVPENLPPLATLTRHGEWLIDKIWYPGGKLHVRIWGVGSGRLVAECTQRYDVPTPPGVERYAALGNDSEGEWAMAQVRHRLQRNQAPSPIGLPEDSAVLAWRIMPGATLMVDQVRGLTTSAHFVLDSKLLLVQSAGRTYAWQPAAGKRYFEISTATASDLALDVVERELAALGLND